MATPFPPPFSFSFRLQEPRTLRRSDERRFFGNDLHELIHEAALHAKGRAGASSPEVVATTLHGLEDLARVVDEGPTRRCVSFPMTMEYRITRMLNSVPDTFAFQDRLDELLQMADTVTTMRAVLALRHGHPTESPVDTLSRLDDSFVLRALVSLHGLSLRGIGDMFVSEGATYAALCARAFLRPPEDVPTELQDGQERTDLHAVMRRLSGNGGLRCDKNFPPEAHQGLGGACSAFAEVTNEVLEAGGRYVVVAGNRFDPSTITACNHVAVRVGDFVVDCLGVHDWGDFAVRWMGDPFCIHEPDGDPDAGFLKAFRNQKDPKLNCEAFRHDLKEATGGPLPRRDASINGEKVLFNY